MYGSRFGSCVMGHSGSLTRGSDVLLRRFSSHRACFKPGTGVRIAKKGQDSALMDGVEVGAVGLHRSRGFSIKSLKASADEPFLSLTLTDVSRRRPCSCVQLQTSPCVDLLSLVFVACVCLGGHDLGDRQRLLDRRVGRCGTGVSIKPAQLVVRHQHHLPRTQRPDAAGTMRLVGMYLDKRVLIRVVDAAV